MKLLAERALEELQAAGARPRRPAITGPGALTAAEHRIAALVATGRSNREIAEQLYVSRRTVETHLTHVFQKLEISNRAQLQERLSRDGTGPTVDSVRLEGALPRRAGRVSA
jgi:DNA-binding CsgD family transcriptional regulator